MLASAMVLAATDTAQSAVERPLLLLLDDPAEELDANAIQRLMGAIARLGCQVIATSLERASLSAPAGAGVFHVEHGVLTPESAD